MAPPGAEPQGGRIDFSAPPPRRDRTGPVALALSVAWVAAVAAYGAGLLLGEGDGPSGLAALLLALAAAVPPALIAGGAALLVRTEALRAETAALRAEIRALAAARAPGGNAPLVKAAADAARAAAAAESRGLAPRLEAIEAALGAIRERVEAAPEPRRAGKTTEPPRPARAADQPALPFAEAQPPAEPDAIAWGDVARALDFPRHEQDAEGFAAIRSALRDPEFARLLQAAEDVLSMLAAQGLHMEDLRPEPATPAAWRAYAEGARGPRVASVGGVLDEGALTVARARLREDPVFRDACHVFVRRWSVLVARVFRELGEDPVILDLAGSRSGRAFMLAARALGAFD